MGFFDQNKDNNKSEIVQKLKSKFRMVIMNDETFEERASVSLTPLNVFIWGGISILVFILIIFSLIAFTSLREYIPGYADVETRENAIYAAFKADSLQGIIHQQQIYIDNINAVINGEPIDRINQVDSSDVELIDEPKKDETDSILKKMVEIEDGYNIAVNPINKKEESLSNLYFYPPLKGMISNKYDQDHKHYGMDIVANKNEAIKSIMNGTVIFSAWTPETGHVIQVQHAYNIVSVYKHNSRLLKKDGDVVKAGEAIAIIGNTGEFSTGPHLHFELWFEGSSIDPEKFITF